MTDETEALRRSTARAIRPEKNGATKVIRARRGKRWNNRDEAAFLEELAATCNVRAAAARVGFSTTAVYLRRRKDPGFAAEWAGAIDQGYAELEALLVEKATCSLRGEALPAPAADEEEPRLARAPMTVAEALNLLRLHRAEARGGRPQDYRAREKAPDMDAVRARILKKVAAIKAARKKPPVLRA